MRLPTFTKTFLSRTQVFTNFTTKKVPVPMRDCDIKFVNKEITPFGGLSLFFKMLEKCHFEEHIMQSGVPLQGSNRGYKPIQLILGLFAGVWCGASCFGHLDAVRYDTALCDLLGWKRGADHRAYQRYLNKFSQAVNQRVFGYFQSVCQLYPFAFIGKAVFYAIIETAGYDIV